MRPTSPKQSFLTRGGSDDDAEHFENLMRVERTLYKPGEKQAEMHRSLERVKLVRGGLGAGKSRWAGEHINNLALAFPGSRFLIGRRDLPALKKTTQHEFLEKVVSPETVETFNVNDNVLYYKNRSEAHFVQTKTPEDFKSFEGVGAFIDEADENETDAIYTNINPRLRQKIWINGEYIEPPYSLLFVFNPTDDQHWLYRLAHSGDPDVADFRLATRDNLQNLPDSYLPMLYKQLPAWDHQRLIEGHWGRQIKGKPVYHGFTPETHVRALRFQPHLPLLRGWDFGYNHPAVCFMQMDPVSGRLFVLREFVGNQIYLPQLVEEVTKITTSLGGANCLVFDYGDPHGADKKDNAESSIEYLRTKHNIHVNYRREQIKTGMDEIQHKILTEAPLVIDGQLVDEGKNYPLWMVDPSCPITIAAYRGGYHRDEDGIPVKDGFYDHITDTHRYVTVHNMNLHLARLRNAGKRSFYVPRNPVTGY